MSYMGHRCGMVSSLQFQGSYIFVSVRSLNLAYEDLLGGVSELPLNLYCKIAEFFLIPKTAVIPNLSGIYFCYYLKDGVCCRYSLDGEVVQMSAHSRICCGCSLGAPVPAACGLAFRMSDV